MKYYLIYYFSKKVINISYDERIFSSSVSYLNICNDLYLGMEKVEKNRKENVSASEIDDSLKEDYDYVNKKASRLVIKSYISQIGKKGLIKPFNKQKALILTHIDALDLKEILLPLGYRKQNIYIIEREKAVFNEMKKREFFRECHLLKPPRPKGRGFLRVR
jgi:hypothetical protein